MSSKQAKAKDLKRQVEKVLMPTQLPLNARVQSKPGQAHLNS
jgi:hypothetical protein